MDPAIISWRELLAHLGRWLANLARASQARKETSRLALQGVVQAVRQTHVYQRMLRQQPRDFSREEQLAMRWTELSFALDDLQLGALAKRCRITGRYWADPDSLDAAFIDAAGARLEQIERQALALLQQLN